MATEPDNKDETRGKRPRWGLAFRLLIYIPLLGIFGWKAGQRILTQRRGADDNFRTYVQARLHAMPAPRTITLPNGETMPVFELSEHQAIEMGLLPAPAPAGEATTAATAATDE